MSEKLFEDALMHLCGLRDEDFRVIGVASDRREVLVETKSRNIAEDLPNEIVIVDGETYTLSCFWEERI